MFQRFKSFVASRKAGWIVVFGMVSSALSFGFSWGVGSFSWQPFSVFIASLFTYLFHEILFAPAPNKKDLEFFDKFVSVFPDNMSNYFYEFHVHDFTGSISFDGFKAMIEFIENDSFFMFSDRKIDVKFRKFVDSVKRFNNLAARVGTTTGGRDNHRYVTITESEEDLFYRNDEESKELASELKSEISQLNDLADELYDAYKAFYRIAYDRLY